MCSNQLSPSRLQRRSSPQSSSASEAEIEHKCQVIVCRWDKAAPKHRPSTKTNRAASGGKVVITDAD